MYPPQIKADAIIASSFEEVLYLDSDNIPLRDPTYLFDTELYAEEGRPRAVFWGDITKDHRKQAKYFTALPFIVQLIKPLM